MQNGYLTQSMTRDPDRMSPVLRSMITDDQTLDDLTFRLVHNGTRRRSDRTSIMSVSAATCPVAKPEPIKVNHANVRRDLNAT